MAPAKEAMTTIPGRWIAILWTASALLAGAMLLAAHETVSIRTPGAMAIVAGILIAGWLRLVFHDPMTRAQRVARDMAEYVGLFAAISLIGAVASYPDAAQSLGFDDPALARIDGALHFDWVAWYAVVAAHPLLQWAGAIVYQSIFLSPAILLGHYALSGRKAAARRFLLAFWIGAMLTLTLFPHLVALGPLAYLWRGPVPYMPTSALYQLQLIPPLRSHALDIVDVGALRGLVCAPSFHTTCAVIYAAFAWRERALRWPLAVLNGTMLLATPVEGTHYLADMILGAIVASAAVAAALMVPASLAVRTVRRRAIGVTARSS